MDCQGRIYNEEGARNWKTASIQLPAFTASPEMVVGESNNICFLHNPIFRSSSSGGRNAKISAVISIHNFHFVDRGSTVVKVLCYKLGGRWFDSRWYHWNFSLNNASDRTMGLGST